MWRYEAYMKIIQDMCINFNKDKVREQSEDLKLTEYVDAAFVLRQDKSQSMTGFVLKLENCIVI